MQRKRTVKPSEERRPSSEQKGFSCYRITVEGRLSDAWSERLGGLRIVTRCRKNEKPLTILSGLVRDQAALFGVLNSLYELQLKILSVESASDDA